MTPADSLARDPASGQPARSDAAPRGGMLVRRHRLSTRLWHWLNLVTLTIMLMSGLMIFNAHPRLYWGAYGANRDHAWLQLPRFPGWATLPSSYSLADARIWHLAFAWVLALALLGYLLRSLRNGHIRRDLHITAAEWRPAHLWRDVVDHARLRFPAGAAALRYNVLQKLAYCGVLFGLLPLVILTGLTMSPGLNAALPWLLDLFGGRQSARSLHFLAAAGLVLFALVHVTMVVLAGPVNELRSMITGWYRLPRERSHD
ncbi:cytochrome b/b6 domain-containing protein [Novosphingobium piscinae]|uniref:Cytochrome b/b6 domain-containing protein n=2 Tax=Novosphingobium piscinae TaxID=1507448 RepID=A0A7X1FYN3_9SPHN|nr:cytochrome b/b6 domain-containing protein [Novosphingobium piscinae]